MTLDQKASRQHWDENLDPQNLQAEAGARDLQTEWEFYTSDEALFAQSHFPPLKNAICVELGAGLGTHAVWMAQQGATVIAVDFSRSRLLALQVFAQRLGLQDRIHCLNCAAEAMPLNTGCADVVYTKSVLIHTRLPEALAECRRILTPKNGKAIFMEPCGKNPFAAFVRRFFAPQEWKAFTRYFDEWSADQVENAFPGAIRKPYFLLGFLPFVFQFHWSNLRLFKLGLAIIRPLDRLAFMLIPPLRRWAWFNVFVGTKRT